MLTMDDNELTFEGGAQRHWSDRELYPRDPMSVQGMGQSVAVPQPVQQPAAAAPPRQQEPLFIAPGSNPKNDPFAPPAGRSYAHPRLAPTWQHASVGGIMDGSTGENIYRLLVIGGMAALGYVALPKWQGAASGGLLGLGVTQIGNFAMTRSYLQLLIGLGAVGGGGYWMLKASGRRLPFATANRTPSWMKPCEGCAEGNEDE